MRREILGGKQPAFLFHERDNAFRQLAAIQGVGAILRDGTQGRRELGLPEQRPDGGRLATGHEQTRELR
jgi:hypothetical protein